MKRISYLFVLLMSVSTILGQSEIPGLLWYETYSSDANEEVSAASVKQTADGGFVFIGDDGIYLTKVDMDGEEVWTKSYDIISEEGLGNQYIQTTSDGGFIVSGSLYKSGNNAFLAKLSAIGDTTWTRSYKSATGDNARGHMVLEAADGGYLLVGDASVSGRNDDIWLLKTAANGDTLWTKTFGTTNNDGGLAIIADGVDFVLAGYIETPDDKSIPWLAKIDGNGDMIWENSFDLGPSASANAVVKTSDGGLAFLANIGETHMGLMKVDVNGDSVWAQILDGSIEVDARPGNELIHETSDGGFVILGIDLPTYENPEILIIKTNADGIEEDRLVIGGPVREEGRSIQMLGDSEYIISGQARNDAFLLRLGIGGKAVEPDIISITDVSNDQGGRVFVNWAAGFPELFGSIIQYGIFIENDTGAWVSLGSAPATGDEVYSFLASTFGDSSAAGNDGDNFLVTAHTTSPSIYHQSAIMSGYSVDNLAPASPSTLSASLIAGGVELGWGVPVDADFAYFNVYRGTTAGFEIDPSQPLAQVTDAKYTDGTTMAGTDYYYKVSAFDVHGNESKISAEVSVSSVITGVEGSQELPTEFALVQNYPNPFNPTTTIRFGMPEQANVSLVVYDIMGREIEQLMEGDIAAGYHQVVWSGLNQFGRTVPSGIYIARLVASEYAKSMKMVLLR